MPATAVALVRAAHPLPTVAVTALTTALAIATGTSPARTTLLAAAVFAGQASVGLHNDLVDRRRDASVGRVDKPLASGTVAITTARSTLVGALVTCVVLSLLLGPAPAAAHLSAVAAAGAYNGGLGGGTSPADGATGWWATGLKGGASPTGSGKGWRATGMEGGASPTGSAEGWRATGLKGTRLSWAPYTLAFALLPVTVWLVSPIGTLPPWWLIAATALLGTGAHTANVLPDLADDRATGVRGMPHRLPERVLRVVTAALLFAGLALVTIAPDGMARWEPVALGTGAALAAVAGLPGSGRRRPLLAAIGIGTLAVAILVARGAAS